MNFLFYFFLKVVSCFGNIQTLRISFQCSKSCGGGVRRRQVACYDNKGHVNNKCDLSLRPSDTSICNEDRCPGWRMSPWSQV